MKMIYAIQQHSYSQFCDSFLKSYVGEVELISDKREFEVQKSGTYVTLYNVFGVKPWRMLARLNSSPCRTYLLTDYCKASLIR